jgi:hypothetical protein
MRSIAPSTRGETRHAALVLSGAFLLAGGVAAQDTDRPSGSASRDEDRREVPERADEYGRPAPSYGWHYEWEPQRKEWVRTYGWYEEFYEDLSGTLRSRASGRAWSEGAWDTGASGWSEAGASAHDGIVWSDEGWDASARDPRARAQDQILTGTIESFGRRRESDGMRYLLRVRDDRGLALIVDLGTRVRPAELALRRGDTVRFRGGPATRDGMHVFRATAFSPELPRPDLTEITGERAGRPGAGRVVLTGRLDELRAVEHQGTRDRSLVVLLERADATTCVVDLGPSESVRALDLRRGDEITVVGEPRESAGRPVLYAYEMRVGDRSMSLRSADELLREESADAGSRSLRGELLRAERTWLAGFPETHLLVRLELADGSTEVVDFGGGIAFADLGLDPGDRVHVRGEQELRAGVRLLRAEELSVNGEPVDVVTVARETSVRRAGPGEERRVELSGTLESFEETRLAELPAENLFVRVLLHDGTTRILDLGTALALADLGLERGKTVRIAGTERTVAGRTIVRAAELEVGGRTIPVGEVPEQVDPEPR